MEDNKEQANKEPKGGYVVRKEYLEWLYGRSHKNKKTLDRSNEGKLDNKGFPEMPENQFYLLDSLKDDKVVD